MESNHEEKKVTTKTTKNHEEKSRESRLGKLSNQNGFSQNENQLYGDLLATCPTKNIKTHEREEVGWASLVIKTFFRNKRINFSVIG
ncbi:MAG: hypothetical protein CL609_17495 [Anaerolineaceae bacterium]|nr:hypothetical protein [Anaerolineaceae bacterium]